MGIINKTKALAHEIVKNHPKLAKHPRSNDWPKIAKSWISTHNICEACGGIKRLNVHHIKPFHQYPELELDPNNLITLCMGEHECHIKIGHGGNFRTANESVVVDTQIVYRCFQTIQETINKARTNRV